MPLWGNLSTEPTLGWFCHVSLCTAGTRRWPCNSRCPCGLRECTVPSSSSCPIWLPEQISAKAQNVHERTYACCGGSKQSSPINKKAVHLKPTCHQTRQRIITIRSETYLIRASQIGLLQDANLLRCVEIGDMDPRTKERICQSMKGTGTRTNNYKHTESDTRANDSTKKERRQRERSERGGMK